MSTQILFSCSQILLENNKIKNSNRFFVKHEKFIFTTILYLSLDLPLENRNHLFFFIFIKWAFWYYIAEILVSSFIWKDGDLNSHASVLFKNITKMK